LIFLAKKNIKKNDTSLTEFAKKKVILQVISKSTFHNLIKNWQVKILFLVDNIMQLNPKK